MSIDLRKSVIDLSKKAKVGVCNLNCVTTR